MPDPHPRRVRARTRGVTGYRNVARPTKWGNPFVIGDHGDRATVVDQYSHWLHAPAQAELRRAARLELAGHDLGCTCPLDEPCHADVLLAVANGNDR